MRYLTLIILWICSATFGYAQQKKDAIIISTDTVYFQSSLSAKWVAYQYRKVVLLVEFASFREELTRLSNSQYHIGAVKAALKKIDREIAVKDTACFDQAEFDQLNWVPLEWFVCNQLSAGKCKIVDEKQMIHDRIIRQHVILYYNGRIGWTGWRYYLPEADEWFYQCTESES